MKKVLALFLAGIISNFTLSSPVLAGTRYVQTGAQQTIGSDTYTDIKGLTLILPQANLLSGQTNAIVTLNLPIPYAQGANFPGITYRILADGVEVGSGGFTYISQQPQSFGRVPSTLVANVQLSTTKQTVVTAQWLGVRGSIGIIDTYASLSAVW
ncbi:hypothetical protein [Nostoc sphaeroides]|uniref:Bc2l-C N-terminal domain-containing protein n=1 Tax=Nostoc sphaeroides CCNUC1 TaxID=2653204 RepID=A0A5P8WH24_9NOSO|nr:hypothetical protein [Nostoc sphaeroides]MCC5632455.1 hypothetical protein [Nostoc sphaeroides CHAB 2801]MCC5632925.1 hypothetical protein [Nostoc sphaeroides CHAB 2801]QFS52147.1 hypothetical protein GXM_09641 [Nostoc sphaeroides CCNUC1]